MAPMSVDVMRRRRVPWDWTDILIFVGVMLLLPAGTDDQGRLLTLAGQAIRFGGYVTHLVDTGLQPSSRNALESFTGQTRNAVFGRLAGRSAVAEN